MPFSKLSEKYRAYLYIRLSKEDGDKLESNSITNQRDLIYSYLKTKPEIEICGEKVDDGYSGVTFERPGLKELLVDVKSGLINCIIVKDLSRFGRNYIETGRYLEEIFPFLGVRFIAVNDNFDSAATKNQSDSIIVPFKNLMNDAYSRDISIKVRSQLDIRKKKGDYIGAFPLYGYKRSEEDKHVLEIDEHAANVVRNIFKWKNEGYSNYRIAMKLNDFGVLSPLEYKELLQWKYCTSFKLKPQAKWSAQAVGRILKNEIYTGTMVQGREGTINYKIKKRIMFPEEEWIRVEGTHEPIVSKECFELASKQLERDTRISPGKEFLYLFSGFLFCDDCKESMVRKLIRSNGKEYVYYICSTYKSDKSSCTNHRIREKDIEISVLEMLIKQIELVCELDDMLKQIEELPLMHEEVKKMDQRLYSKKDELTKYQKLRISIYEDYKTGFLSKDYYLELKSSYEAICNEIEGTIDRLENEIDDLLKNRDSHSLWIEEFKKNKNLGQLTRVSLGLMVDKIMVIDKKNIKILFKYQSEFENAMRLLQMTSRFPSVVHNDMEVN